VTATLTPPPKRLGVTHWSSRLLAAKLTIDHAPVARAWKHYGIQPWQSRTFKFSTGKVTAACRPRHRATSAGRLWLRGRAHRISGGCGSDPC